MSFVFNDQFEIRPHLVVIWSKSRVNRENYLENFPPTDLYGISVFLMVLFYIIRFNVK